MYIYNTYDGYMCYFCNRNIPTAPQFQTVRSGAWRWAPTVLILAFLFSNPDVGVHVFKDVQLIRTSRVCCTCGSQMSWCVNTNLKASETVWRCRRITSVSECSASRSIRHDSCFQQSNLNLKAFVPHLYHSYIRTRSTARGKMCRHSSIFTTAWETTSPFVHTNTFDSTWRDV